MVPVDDDRVAEKRRRAAFAETGGRALIAEVLAPLKIPGHVVTMQPARTEPGEDPLAVRDRRVRRVTVIRMVALVRHRIRRDALPECLAGLAVDAKQNKLMKLGRLLPASAKTSASSRPSARRRSPGGSAGAWGNPATC